MEIEQLLYKNNYFDVTNQKLSLADFFTKIVVRVLCCFLYATKKVRKFGGQIKYIGKLPITRQFTS